MVKKRPKDKKPNIPPVSPIIKVPSYLGPPNLENTHLAWRFSSADLGGPYSCANFSHDKFKQLWNRLRTFETRNEHSDPNK